MAIDSVSCNPLPAYPWDDITSRLKNIGLQHPVGVCKVTITVMMQNGYPVQWIESGVSRLEPKSSALQFLELIEDQAKQMCGVNRGDSDSGVRGGDL